jgi:tRNA(Ile)-lysidine synthase TilS/MesJ
MIAPGDRIAIGVSGGKDSLLLLQTLAELRAFYPQPFEIEAVTLHMGMPGMDYRPVRDFCRTLGVGYTVVPTDILHVVLDIRKEENPCSLCAKLRRGALHDAALGLGCRKVALGHHCDDAVETFLLAMLYEERLYCFTPVTYLDRKDITLIRPMLYVDEHLVRETARRLALPVVHNPCPANGHTKRQEVKELITELSGRYPGLRDRLFRAVKRGLWANDN